MKSATKLLAFVCIVLVTVTAFQSVSACGGGGRDQWDFVIDENGWVHGVYIASHEERHGRDIPQVFYVDNIDGRWNEPVQISDSTSKASYPQISIDEILNITYITWLDDGPHDRPIYYAGSADWSSWSQPHPSDKIVDTGGNPHIEMSAGNGTLELTWKHGGSAVIVADLDFDMIPDYTDVQPFSFDIDFEGTFNTDLIQYSPELDITVALDFISGTGSLSITSATPPLPLNSSINNYFEVIFTGDASYIAYIKAKYDPLTLPIDLDPRHLRMYWLKNEDWSILMDSNESTGVNVNNSYVWSQLNHLSIFVSGDATNSDSDWDGLTDGSEMNIDGSVPQWLTTFGDGTSTKTYTLPIPGAGEVGSITVPLAGNAITNVNVSWLNISGQLNPLTSLQSVGTGTQPFVRGDKIVWRSVDSIMLKNLTNGIIGQASSIGHPGVDSSPSVFGDWIVWTREYPVNTFTIIGWNNTYREEILITNGRSPDIWNDDIVCIRTDGIVKCDLTTHDEIYIASGSFTKVRICNDFIVYSSPTAIRWFDLVTNIDSLIVSSYSTSYQPIFDLADSLVAYVQGDMFIYDLITKNIKCTFRLGGSSQIWLCSYALSDDSLFFGYRDNTGYAHFARFQTCTGEWTNFTEGGSNAPDYYITADLDKIAILYSNNIYLKEQKYKPVIELKVGNEPTPVWSSMGWLNFKGTPEISYQLNSYIRSYCYPGQSGNIPIPLTLYWSSPCTVTLSTPTTYISPICTINTNWDTSDDDIADGWSDINKNMVFDTGDTQGKWQMTLDSTRQNFIGTATSRCAAGIVDIFNGNVRLKYNLMPIGSGSWKRTFDLVYNSQLKDVITPIGAGWDSPFYACMVQKSNGDVEYHNGEGDVYYFKQYAGSLYSSPPGFTGRLLRPTGGYWYLSFPDGSVNTFDHLGKLMQIQDKNGRGFTFNYGGNNILSSITATGDSYISINYNSQKKIISSLTDQIGRAVSFSTSTIYLINTINVMGEYTLIFNFDTGKKLTSSVSPLGLTTLYTYQVSTSGIAKVSQIVQNGITVAQFGFTYPKSTITTDAASQNSEMTFNQLGMAASYTDPSNIKTTMNTDYQGNIISYTDGKSQTYQLTYNAYGQTSKIVYPNGAVESIEYATVKNSLFNVSLIKNETNSNNLTIQHSYDAIGNEIKTSYPERNAIYMRYLNGELVEQRALNGARTLYTYNAGGNMLNRTDALNGLTTWTYDTAGRQLSMTDANGFTYLYGYNNRDQVTSITDPFGFIESKQYNAAGNLLSVEDKNGFITYYTYDVFGRKTADTNPLGFSKTYTYDSVGRLIKTTNEKGAITRNIYDASGRLIKTTNPLGHSTNFSYDANGNQVFLNDSLGHNKTKGYDSLNRLIWEKDSLGNNRSYSYDSVGNLINTTDPLGNVWKYRYDNLNRRIAETNPVNSTIRYVYDEQGNLVSMTDACNNTWSYQYDALNRKTAEITPLDDITTYGYDEVGNLVSVTDANGNTLQYAYDALNRKTSETTPLGNVQQYSYDPVGNLVSRTDGNGAVTTYQYCPLNRIIRTNYSDGTYIITGYDVCFCNPTSEILYAANGTIINGYNRSIDLMGRSTSVTTNYGTFNKTVGYTYNAVGNVATVTSVGRTITYAYDANNRATSVSDPSLGTVLYAYDAAGRTISRTIGAIATTCAYDNASRLKYTTTSHGTSVWNHSYQYDANGQRTSMKTQDPIWGALFHNYTYDANGRLTEVEYPWSQVTYEYDAVGNRLTETEGIYRKNYVYNEENQLTDLTLFATKPYIYPIHRYEWEYDGNGNQRNQTIINGTTGPLYSYDYENRLTLVQINPYSSTPKNVSYAYLPNGDRIKRANDTETIYYLYDREDVIATLNSAGTPLQTFLHGPGIDEPVLMKTGSTICYYVQDGLGTTRALIKTSDNTVAAAYLYDAWGNVVNHTGPLSEQNSYLFTGREYDWQTGVYYYRARSYDSELGRFLQRDPEGMVDGTNMYAYVGNDPINNKDPSGTFSTTESIALCLAEFFFGITASALACIATAVAIDIGVCIVAGILSTGAFVLTVMSCLEFSLKPAIALAIKGCEAGEVYAISIELFVFANCLWKHLIHYEYGDSGYSPRQHRGGSLNPKIPQGGTLI